ncbi:ferrous iron transport protein B [Phorcysia thermohydrogeniphila]|uniref:Ferrous iron transport protein B n=1 Tax=Phorcysia thermohydrogeniphila TaxID=936138 RepID=A0A4R1G7N3_9BACT|nr:ferrous iron transport protein B [Phorcysia thermohydrogeniphila]TCK02530.1 ferrous iron transport protein B [Phorcysia thermohydrogeniphila]
MKRSIRVAIAGNPNVGKTAIMNALAGTTEKVGNWPGVTVQKKVGKYNFRGVDVELIDLPGIYSLTSYTLEERVARSFLLKGDYDVVMNVIDVTLLGRNLYLTLELLEMGIKPVLVLNKADELENFSVDSKALERILKLPVVTVSALKRKGLEELSETLLRVATGGLKPEGITPTYSEDLENAIELLSMKIERLITEKNFPYNLRWFVIKLLEKDPEVTEEAKEQLKLPQSIFREIEKIEEFIKERHRCDLPSYIARERFNLASQIARKVIKSIREIPKERISDRIDRFVTNPFTGIPIFFGVMWLVFKLTFDLSAPLSNLIDIVFSRILPSLVESYLSSLPPFVTSLINNGVLAGVGAVMVFLPVLGILYLTMSILEDTGYMARAAALWDNFMRLFGLSGASVIPMILGFGCNVPAVYATRAMRSTRQKLITMLIIPWISCSARLPVYAVFVAAFFREKESLVIFSLYLLGVLLALTLGALLSKSFKPESEEEDFFIELPPYKLPAWSVVFNQTWIEVREFVYKAGTVILALSVFIWALASLPPGVDYAGEGSIVGHVGKWLLPIFEPLGISDWKPVVALIFGALAKEVVVGTLGTLYGAEENVIEAIAHIFTPASALAFMVFTLLYMPCIATIAAIKHESGTWKYPILAIAIELTTAWVIAFGVYHVASLFLK